MVTPEPWRKTGRKAKDDHLIGLSTGAMVELAAYDDQGRQQGRAVMKLARPGQDQGGSEGEMWIGQFLAVEDEYYEWWAGQTFPDGKVPVHFCIRPAQKCSEATLYRNPIHADVFRILPGRSATV